MSKLRMSAKLKAKKKPEHKAAVEGDAPRQRLDRPSRMRRADGGPTISEDSKKEAAKLRASADAKTTSAGAGVLTAAGAASHLLGMALMRNKFVPFTKGEKLTGAASGVAGTAGAAKAYADKDKVWDAKGEREEAARIERGEAEPGKEDRKKGGRVKS